jgi:hypothetical protein
MRSHTFTPECIDQIRDLVEHGKSKAEISDVIGCTTSTLKTMCSRLGVSLRRPRNGAEERAKFGKAKGTRGQLRGGGIGQGRGRIAGEPVVIPPVKDAPTREQLQLSKRRAMPLSSEEAHNVYPIAWSLPPDRAAEFIHAVESALASYSTRGPGLAHRVAVALLPTYFVPPKPPREQLHVNIRLGANPTLFQSRLR